MQLERKLKYAIMSNDIDKIHSVFDDIYITYGRLVYFKIMQYIENKSDVEELTQEVFISFYNNILYVEVKNIKYYLLTSAKNKSIDYLRKKREKIVFDENMVYEYEDIKSTNIEYESIIEKMKMFLSELEIEIILKHNIDGYSFKEIAKEYNRPVNTILSIYNRSLKKFKKGCEKNEIK